MTKSVIPSTPSAAEYAADGSRDLSWVEAADPIALFETWLAAAGETEPNDPHAMINPALLPIEMRLWQKQQRLKPALRAAMSRALPIGMAGACVLNI